MAQRSVETNEVNKKKNSKKVKRNCFIETSITWLTTWDDFKKTQTTVVTLVGLFLCVKFWYAKYMSWMRHAKVICTIGPATFSPKIIEDLIIVGMDVARLNFSHGDSSTYERVIRTIREKSRKLKKPVTIIQDLQGPKIRTGKLCVEKIPLKKGAHILITTQNVIGDEKMISIPYLPLPRLLKKGNSILIDDGLIELRVLETKSHFIECVVINGGNLREHKGVNIPYIKTKGEALTFKDKKDLAFGIRQGIDFVAMSFVRRGDDIETLRRRIPKSKNIGIIAKIEKREAIDHFDEILEVSDAIMVARGDLAVESSSEVVPCLQKEIIQKCNRAMKPVITATQMLESMAKHPRPTRAEASDVANAVLDGSDALMLSSETAFGKYPIESVVMMDKIIREIEHHQHHYAKKRFFIEPHLVERHVLSVDEKKIESNMGVIEKAACQIAEGFHTKLICCLTETGRSAAYLSSAKPRQPIIALTDQQSTLRKLSLVWGVYCYYIKNLLRDAKIFNSIRKRLLELKMVKRGDQIVVTTGVFTRSQNTTRITKVHEI